MATWALTGVVESGMAPWGGTGGAGMGFIWPLFGLLLIAMLVIGDVYLLGNQTRTISSDNAMEILREQYAQGEVTTEEFENRSSRLSAGDDSFS